MEKGLGIDKLEQRKTRRTLRKEKTLLRAYGIEKEEIIEIIGLAFYSSNTSTCSHIIILFICESTILIKVRIKVLLKDFFLVLLELVVLS